MKTGDCSYLLKTEKMFTAIILMSLLMFIPIPGSMTFAADSEEEQEVFTLDEVVVTATRHEKKVDDLSGNVDVISRSEIEESTATTIPGLMESIPGIFVNDNYGNGMSISVGLRGVEPGRGLKVLVMVNGVPMNSGSTGAVFWKDLPSSDQIERIEVVKGPVSALYGGYGIGGCINIITKKGPVAPKTVFKAEAGSNAEKIVSLESGGNIRDKFSYQMGYSAQEGDGYRDRSTHESDKFSANLGYAITASSDINLDLGYSDVFHEVPGTLTKEQFEEDPTQAESQIGVSDMQRTYANLVFRKDIGTDDSLNVSLYRHSYEMDYVFTSGLGNYIYDVSTLGGEIQYTMNDSLSGMDNTLIFGPTVRSDSADTIAYRTNDEGEKTGDPKSNTLAEPLFWSLYAQDELNLTDNLTLTLGLRYDRASFENEDRLDPDNSGESDMKAFSPKAGISYKISDKTTLFANMGKGFSPPSVSKLFGSSGNPDLEPETAINYEISMRTAPYDWIDFTAAAYRMEVEGEIIYVNVDGNAKYINAGETLHKGLETELNLTLPKGFSSFFNFTWQDVTFTDYSVYSSRSRITTVYDGNNLPSTPDTLFSAGIKYRNSAGINYSLTAVHEDEKFTDEANKYAVPAYTVCNTRLEYKNRFNKIGYSFHVSVRNLFDKKYYSDGSGEDVYPSLPRTYMAGLTLEF